MNNTNRSEQLPEQLSPSSQPEKTITAPRSSTSDGPSESHTNESSESPDSSQHVIVALEDLVSDLYRQLWRRERESRRLAAALRWALLNVRLEPAWEGWTHPQAEAFENAKERAEDILDEARNRHVEAGPNPMIYGSGGADPNAVDGDRDGEGTSGATHECAWCLWYSGYGARDSFRECTLCDGTGRGERTHSPLPGNTLGSSRDGQEEKEKSLQEGVRMEKSEGT